MQDANEQARLMLAGAEGGVAAPQNPAAVDALKQLVIALTKKVGKRPASRQTVLFQNALANALAVIKDADPQWHETQQSETQQKEQEQ